MTPEILFGTMPKTAYVIWHIAEVEFGCYAARELFTAPDNLDGIIVFHLDWLWQAKL